MVASSVASLGCGPVQVFPTDARDLPTEAQLELSPGDTREKVPSALGIPYIEAPGHPVEVYRYIGRDLGIHLPFLPIPIPLPGDEVMGFALVVYDSNQKVIELATDIWVNATLSRRKNCQITAGGYRFVYTFVAEPETFLGPAVSTHQNARNSTDYGNQSQMHRYSTDRSVSIAT